MIKLSSKIIRIDDTKYIRVHISTDRKDPYDECVLEFRFNTHILPVGFVDFGNIVGNKVVIKDDVRELDVDILYFEELTHIKCTAQYIIKDKVTEKEFFSIDVETTNLIKHRDIQYFSIAAQNEDDLKNKLSKQFSPLRLKLSQEKDEILIDVIKGNNRKTELSIGIDSTELSNNDFLFALDPGISEIRVPLDYDKYPNNFSLVVSEIVTTNINDKKYKTTISDPLIINTQSEENMVTIFAAPAVETLITTGSMTKPYVFQVENLDTPIQFWIDASVTGEPVTLWGWQNTFGPPGSSATLTNPSGYGPYINRIYISNVEEGNYSVDLLTNYSGGSKTTPLTWSVQVALPTLTITVNNLDSVSPGGVYGVTATISRSMLGTEVYTWESTDGKNVTISSPVNTTTNSTVDIDLPDKSPGDGYNETFTFRVTVVNASQGEQASTEFTITTRDAPDAIQCAVSPETRTYTLPESGSIFMDDAIGASSTTSGVTYLWIRQAGPASLQIDRETTRFAEFTFNESGVYEIVFAATKASTAQSCSASMVITINETIYAPLIVDTGEDRQIDPPDTVTLNMVITGGKTPYSFNWTQVAGPGVAQIVNPTNQSTDVTIGIEGSWLFRGTATDDKGSFASDEVAIYSADEPIPLSVAASGSPASGQVSFNVSLNSVVAGGTSPYSYVWEETAGNGSQLSGATSTSATASITVEGSYTYRLTVTDDDGNNRSDTVNISALPADIPPPPVPLTVSAGSDQSVNIPLTVYLNGSASGGTTPYTYQWQFSSGPGGVIPTINNQTSNNADVFISEEGTYVFALSVNDNNSQAISDSVTIFTEAGAGWPNEPGGDGGDASKGTQCDTTNTLTIDNCKSKNRPDVAYLSSGKTALVYESRNDKGQTGLSMTILDTTVKDRVFYYRSLSLGRLINDENLAVYGKSTFEVYDDMIVEVDSNGVPYEKLQIGFLNGQLAERLYDVETIIRETSGAYHSISFDTGGAVDLKTTNDIWDINWFLIKTGDYSFPISNTTSTVVDPSDGPVAHPSVASAQNNLMVGQEDHVFITYQRYIDNTRWDVYFSHFVLSNNASTLPAYEAPYDTGEVIATKFRLVGSAFTEVVYKQTCVVDLSGDDSCTLFSVWLVDGRRVYSCDGGSGEPAIGDPNCDSCSAGQSASLAWVYVYHPGETCGSAAPSSWSNSSGIRGTYPPTSATFNDVACNPTITVFPGSDVNNWCYFDADAELIYLIDDPYIPQPYVAVTYHPEDLYVLRTGDNTYATRIVYHMASVNPDVGVESDIYRVFERDEDGYSDTFIRPAEILITYNGDLSDRWTNDKEEFVFVSTAPASTGSQKGLGNFPFTLQTGQIYGVDSVHLHGRWQNWAYSQLGPPDAPFNLDYPNVGFLSEELVSGSFCAINAIRPKIGTNNRNDVFFSYESLENDVNHIIICGTGDFYQNSITGPKANRITRTLLLSDFQYQHSISTPGEGINQLCDFLVDKNDTIHITWQSNRDGYWEIYYANSYDLFDPVRITKSKSRSGVPDIEVHDDGDIFIIYHDNRFGPFQIMMAEKNEDRILPLLQQDAYMASLKSDYTHYVNYIDISYAIHDINLDPIVITIEFYNNKNMEGSPYLTINSRENIEAFENLEYEGVIRFNASDYRPNYSSPFEPYNFAPNQTYFPRVSVMITDDFKGYEENEPIGNMTLLENINISFSCSKCSTTNDNVFGHSACSYSFNIANTDPVNRYYEFEVPFYADEEKRYLIKQFNIKKDHSDLDYVSIESAFQNTTVWTDEGLLIESGESKTIVIYPSLDGQAGFVCGLLYYVSVLCDSDDIEYTVSQFIEAGGHDRSIIRGDVGWQANPTQYFGGESGVPDVDYDTYLKFLINIPKNTTILSSYIQFTSRSGALAGGNTDISVNLLDFSATRSYIDLAFFNAFLDMWVNTPLEGGPVAWNSIPAWALDQRDADTRTTNISSLIQRIVDNDDYSPGDQAAFSVKSEVTAYGVDTYRSSYSYSTPAKAAELTITYKYSNCQDFSAVSGADTTFFCDCASGIFNNNLVPVSSIDRWKSSAHGYSDTKISDIPSDSLRPSAKMKNNGLLLISWENYNNTNPQILMAAYNRDELQGSGSGRLFDFSFNLKGKNVDISTDLYDRMILVNESVNSVDTANLLPVNDIDMTICDFTRSDLFTETTCDITQFTGNVISSDPFISNQIIKKIEIKKDYVDYFTYNSSGTIFPVVSTCNVELKIYGTPEVVAYRIMNEDQTSYTEWTPWSPTISDYYTELSWQLSKNSGIKSVIIQAMAYNGVTNEFLLNVIGDYSYIRYRINLFDSENNPLPLYDNLPVASTKGQINISGREIVTINIEIVLDVVLENTPYVNFDVLQQGESDIYDLIANRDTTNPRVYKGSFNIIREDSIGNKDGLAQINVRFNEDCHVRYGPTTGGPFQRDKYNALSEITVDAIRTDPLSSERDNITGKVGKNAVIRPTDEDPHLIFGDPKYYLTKNEPNTE